MCFRLLFILSDFTSILLYILLEIMKFLLFVLLKMRRFLVYILLFCTFAHESNIVMLWHITKEK